MKNFKKILVILLVLVASFSLISCEMAEDPTSEYPAMEKLNISSSYKGNKDGNFFTFKFNWKIDKNYEATYLLDYELYYAMDEMGPFELCEPVNEFADGEGLYTLMPKEPLEIEVNVDKKYENLPMGYYRFVFPFHVFDENGEELGVYSASVDFDMSM